MNGKLAAGIALAAVLAFSVFAAVSPMQQASAWSEHWTYGSASVGGSNSISAGMDVYDVANTHALNGYALSRMAEPYIFMDYAGTTYDRKVNVGDDAGPSVQVIDINPNYRGTRLEGRMFSHQAGDGLTCNSGTWNVVFGCYKIYGRVDMYDYNWDFTSFGAPKVKQVYRTWGGYYDINTLFPTMKVLWVFEMDTPNEQQLWKYKDNFDCSGWIQSLYESDWDDHGCSGSIWRLYDTSSTSKGFAYTPNSSLAGHEDIVKYSSSESISQISTWLQEQSYVNGEVIAGVSDLRVFTAEIKPTDGTTCDFDSPCNIDNSVLLFGYVI